MMININVDWEQRYGGKCYGSMVLVLTLREANIHSITHRPSTFPLLATGVNGDAVGSTTDL